MAKGKCPRVCDQKEYFVFSFALFLFFYKDLLNFFYNIASVLRFDFLAPRHVGF